MKYSQARQEQKGNLRGFAQANLAFFASFGTIELSPNAPPAQLGGQECTDFT
jgi:hypothetical protein